jgi:hypothetical protein
MTSPGKELPRLSTNLRLASLISGSLHIAAEHHLPCLQIFRTRIIHLVHDGTFINDHVESNDLSLQYTTGNTRKHTEESCQKAY